MSSRYYGNGENPKNHSHVPRVDRRHTSSRSLDYSEHSSNKSDVSSLYTEDFRDSYAGKDDSYNTSRCGIPAAFGDHFQASYNSGFNKLGESDRDIGAYSRRSGNDSSKSSYKRAGTLFDSDQALHGSGIYSEKSGTLFGSNDSCNLLGKTLFDSDQAMCSSQKSGSSNTSVLNSLRGRMSNKVCGSDFSSADLSQRGTSNQRASIDAEKKAARHRTDEMNQLSSISLQRFSYAKPFCGSGRESMPYQIEFRTEDLGKQISASKRNIHFRFGFANESALSKGNTRHDCRGVEHHLCITWSITGSKRLITMDGREVLYSAGKRANESRRADFLEASWVMSDHSYELMCYSYKPSTRPFEKRDSR